MSNKNDPYQYAEKVNKKMNEKPKNFQDSDLESVAGSVQREKPEEVQEVTPTPGGLFGRMKTMVGFGVTPGGPETTPGEFEWEEFPWEKYLVKEDIIYKWRQVDMKVINNLHCNFDAEQGKFVDIPLEKLSIVKTYS